MRFFRAINPQQQFGNTSPAGGGNSATQPSYSLAGMQQPQQTPITQQFMQSGALQAMPYVQQAQYPNQQTPMLAGTQQQQSASPDITPLPGDIRYQPSMDGITPLPGDIRYPWSPPNPRPWWKLIKPQPVQDNWNRILIELGPAAQQYFNYAYPREWVDQQPFDVLKEAYRQFNQPGPAL